MAQEYRYLANWREDYRRKLISAEEAVKVVKSGDRVFLPGFGGDPPTLLNALARRKDELRGVEICSCNPVIPYEHSKPEYEGIFIDNPWFVGFGARGAVQAGRGTYTPCNFGQYDENMKRIPIDVTMIMVSPPDKFGYMSFGVMVGYSHMLLKLAKTVILQVSEKQPRVLGDSFVHVSQADYIVEVNDPIPVLSPITSSEKDEAIGNYIAEQIEDGSTIQLGVGTMPNAVGKFLYTKRDLGIHSEMCIDAMIDLMEAGAITNMKKTLHPGRIVHCFAGGSQRLYDWMNDNPLIEGHPVSYTNDPYIIAKNPKQISINATLEVDFTGQACSESIGTRQYSAVGGQVDFIRGCFLSPGGKAFLCLNSTANTKDGVISCITPTLKVGAAVTTSRNDIDNVVTEYGIASLRGKSVRERAKALINIAHPDFRAELTREAKRLLIL